jgi:sugar lactone lactonase YvrE
VTLFAAAAVLVVGVSVPSPPTTAGEAGAAEPGAGVTLVYPSGLALDRHGNLFIADVGSHQVLKFDRDRRLTVVAGTGEGGFGGDGGPAIAAKLHAPGDLAFDVDGNLLVADTFNHRVRRIDPAGVISTVVGGGKSNHALRETTALAVSLNNPQGIALDSAAILFIADTYNHVVRRVGRDGAVTTFAGTQAGLAGDGGPADRAQLNLPQAVAVGPDGSVYVSDAANSRIRRVGPDGVIRTVAGSGPGSGEGGAGFAGDGGPAAGAKLFSPAGLAFNALGQLYVSDSGNNRVRLIAHGMIVTVAGSGAAGYGGDGAPAHQAALNTPQKVVAAADGSVYVADRVNRCVRRIDPDGVIHTAVVGAAPAAGDGTLVDPSLPAPVPAPVGANAGRREP